LDWGKFFGFNKFDKNSLLDELNIRKTELNVKKKIEKNYCKITEKNHNKTHPGAGFA